MVLPAIGEQERSFPKRIIAAKRNGNRSRVGGSIQRVTQVRRRSDRFIVHRHQLVACLEAGSGGEGTGGHGDDAIASFPIQGKPDGFRGGMAPLPGRGPFLTRQGFLPLQFPHMVAMEAGPGAEASGSGKLFHTRALFDSPRRTGIEMPEGLGHGITQSVQVVPPFFSLAGIAVASQDLALGIQHQHRPSQVMIEIENGEVQAAHVRQAEEHEAFREGA